ncbi:lipoyl(octanoyl) transferase LipB [uncultured Alistipes sp.]|uniref:lipoyl(octanoyl) transferase LipB n=1 Tax=uncultured Alistipes sp. TaxID=538949 RepID=UPI00345BA59F
MRLRLRDLGSMDYGRCWDLQRQFFDALLAAKGAARSAAAAEQAKAAGGQHAAAAEQAKAAEGQHATAAEQAKAAEGQQTGAESLAGAAATMPQAGAAKAVEADAEDVGTLLLVEHPPVYTLGKSGHAENLLVGREMLERLGAQFYHIDRGGDITFHGPGQLVVYPILDLERLGIGLRAYIEALEECVIRVAAHYGLRTGRIAGASGVWLGAGTDYGAAPAAATATEAAATTTEGAATATEDAATATEDAATATEDAATAKEDAAEGAARCIGTAADGPTRKLCAIGVRSSRYITMHGFALNVSTDLRWFERINPCGFRDRGATSLERETGRTIAMEEVKALVAKNLSEILNVEIYK